MTTNHNHNTNRNTGSVHSMVLLDADVERALARFVAAVQQMPAHARPVLARLLHMFGTRLAARDGDAAVTVLGAVGHCAGAEVSAAVLDYCIAVGTRNTVTGGAR